MVESKKTQYMINSTERVNGALNFIRIHTKAKNNQQILSDILTPLAEVLANKENPCGYIVYTSGDQVIIQCYGFGNIVCSGEATASIGQILGVD